MDMREEGEQSRLSDGDKGRWNSRGCWIEIKESDTDHCREKIRRGN
jgi:hypothetical protein